MKLSFSTVRLQRGGSITCRSCGHRIIQPPGSKVTVLRFPEATRIVNVSSMQLLHDCNAEERWVCPGCGQDDKLYRKKNRRRDFGSWWCERCNMRAKLTTVFDRR